jgi:hypothetical protein
MWCEALDVNKILAKSRQMKEGLVVNKISKVMLAWY